jgi:hypothetical protein
VGDCLVFAHEITLVKDFEMFLRLVVLSDDAAVERPMEYISDKSKKIYGVRNCEVRRIYERGGCLDRTPTVERNKPHIYLPNGGTSLLDSHISHRNKLGQQGKCCIRTLIFLCLHCKHPDRLLKW